MHTKDVSTVIADHLTPGKHSSELFGDAAVRFVEGYAVDNPFFLYLSFMAPHDPRSMPVEFQTLYDPEILSLPENFLQEHPFDFGIRSVRDEKLAPFPRTPEHVREHLADYYAMITHLDHQVGRVIGISQGVYFLTIRGQAPLGREKVCGKANVDLQELNVLL